MGGKWAQGADQYVSITDHTSVSIEESNSILFEHKSGR